MAALQPEDHRALLDALWDAVHVVDRDFRLVLINATFLRWLEELGFPTDVVGRTVFEAFPFLPPHVADEYRWVLEHGESMTTTESLNVGGGVRHTETRKVPIRIGGQPALVLTVIHDVSLLAKAEEERRKHESWVIQSQKLESLGTLAGGIAHDFNNLLMAILGRISLARLRRPRDDSDRDLEAAERACKQAAELTKQLLTFAKGGAPVTQLARLGPIVNETVELCLAGSGVIAAIDLRDTFAVRVDPGQIGQVFQNLVINAKQAMNDRGTLRITSEDLDEAGQIWVRVAVTDTGPGISEEVRARIFEPYFTTKAGGSGLGLAVAHAVVSKHGGRLTVDSPGGAGATFTVLLPASRGRVTPTTPGPADARIRAARVLVMDDEADLRALLTQIVELDGHQVVAARDGAEAVELFGDGLRRREPFDVVILDLTVPGGMGGTDAARAILGLDPAAKIVVSSGYSEDPVLASHGDYGFAAALGKPYDVDALRKVLARVLGRGPRASGAPPGVSE